MLAILTAVLLPQVVSSLANAALKPFLSLLLDDQCVSVGRQRPAQ